MKRMILCLLASGIVQGGDLFAPQSIEQVPLNVEIVSTVRTNGVILQELYFAAGEMNGGPGRIFALYARPDGDGPFPGVVALHGSQLRVLVPKESIQYAKEGFACLSIDWWGPGQVMTPPREKPYSEWNETSTRTYSVAGSDGKKREVARTPEQAGVRLGVLAVRRSVMLMKSFKEVDPQNLFLTGISGGGHLTLVTLGVEHSFKAAAMRYGCGFVRDFGADYYAKAAYFKCLKGVEGEDAWFGAFDPKHLLKNYTTPVLVMSGTDDIFFPMPMVLETWRRIPCEKRLMMASNDNHKEVAGEKLPIRYFKSFIGKAPAYPKDAPVTVKETAGQLTFSCDSPCKKTLWVKRMPVDQFVWGKSDRVKWEKVEGPIAKPASGEQLMAYFILEDETGARCATDTVEIPELANWRLK